MSVVSPGRRARPLLLLLLLQDTGQQAIEAMPTRRDRIEIAQVGAVVEFERDPAGHVVAAVLKQGGQVRRGPKQ